MKILGLHKDPWHNSGAAIISEVNQRIQFVNSTQERLDRQKNSRSFPLEATEACMKDAGVGSYKEFDLVVLDYIRNGSDWRKDYYKEVCSVENFLGDVDPKKIKIVNHHLAHAYHVFYASGFTKAAILILDGRGSDQETQSLMIGDLEKGIECLEKTEHIGVGLLYAAVTQRIGFGLLEEGKTMGLAPYGKGGSNQYFNFKQNYHAIETNYSNLCAADSYEMKMEGSLPKSFEEKAGMAYELQQECEQAILHLARHAKKVTGLDHLCISGGVGLNSVANYRVLQSGIFKDIFINPAASDTGIPLGAALYGYHHLMKQPKKYRSISPFLGPCYSRDKIENAMSCYEGYEIIRENALELLADYLRQNKIIGFFHGRSEIGPRALGHRSILMSPLKAENKDYLNARVKFREAFRPYAPAVLEEYAQDYFDIDRPSPYMLMVPHVKDEKREVIPAVMHVDGTARLQTVSQKSDPVFYELIERFFQQTGVPILLNTSFNVAGEPIVETPEDAIRCFLSTNIDVLYLEHVLLIKDPAKLPTSTSAL